MAAGTELSTSEVALSTTERMSLDACAVIIKQYKHAMAWKLVEIGGELKKARKLFGIYNAEFMEWAKSKCGICRTRVYECMQAHDTFGELSVTLDSFTVEAMLLLSRDSTPDEAVEEAIDLANSGEQVTAHIAKAIKEKHQPRKELPHVDSVPLVQGSPAQPGSSDFDRGIEPDDTDDESDTAACDEPPRAVKAKAEAGPVEPSWALYFSKQIDEALADALAGLDKHEFTVRVGVAAYLRDYADKIQGAK